MNSQQEIEILETLASKYSDSTNQEAKDVFVALQNSISVLKSNRVKKLGEKRIEDNEIMDIILLFNANNVSPSYTKLANFFLGYALFKAPKINEHVLYGAYKQNYTRKEMVSICKNYLLKNQYTIYGKLRTKESLN